ncbi:squalene--hopene cyclase [Lederbergia citrea]|uniref:Squalene--hopene cyclase n=1 Tax=Lederbergia citrea TaxID=2833581 RepID=A0A942UH90_9BACI|nr:squalene--hopene cyclase [Lederbergia citrea]MBS4221410.1 squalene--hopene cyclase [Lederbergia citrea]
MNRTENLISHIVQQLKAAQTPNGSWDYPFDTGVSTDTYMIILLRTLEINDEDLIQELSERILSKQEENGAWKLFHDEGNGNLNATVEALYALRYSGYYPKEDKRLQRAKKFILANGGIEKSHMLAKIMFALTGQIPWPAFFPIPVEMILLPPSFPINFYDISNFGRSNLAPIMILATKKYSKKTKRSPKLTDLYISREDDFFNWPETRESKRFFSLISEGIKNLVGLPKYIHSMAINRAKQYMLNHIEPDGTQFSYFSSTFLMIFALLSLGYSKNDPLILNAINGIKSMKCKINGYTHMQYTTANVWNTSLISFALQTAGIPPTDPMITKANQYLLEREQYKYGDWVIHNPTALPGGWGFSDVNTIDPDVDDTTATLRAFANLVETEPTLRQAWDRGKAWALAMQNDDGGWPAFEKNVDKKWLKMLPIEGGRFLLSDASSADLTGRTLEFFGGYTNLPKTNDVMKRGIDWLFHDQKKDGSWYGRWGICYIYGTWAAITGLIASGVDPQNKNVQKGVNWLKQIQNRDGGWGESCKSDLNNTYIPLGSSNVTQTAWALDALISVADKPSPNINAGIAYLLDSYEKSDWTIDYPVGQGMGGGFYIHYHSYQYIFPLLALAHYEKKFQG